MGHIPQKTPLHFWSKQVIQKQNLFIWSPNLSSRLGNLTRWYGTDCARFVLLQALQSCIWLLQADHPSQHKLIWIFSQPIQSLSIFPILFSWQMDKGHAQSFCISWNQCLCQKSILCTNGQKLWSSCWVQSIAQFQAHQAVGFCFVCGPFDLPADGTCKCIESIVHSCILDIVTCIIGCYYAGHECFGVNILHLNATDHDGDDKAEFTDQADAARGWLQLVKLKMFLNTKVSHDSLPIFWAALLTALVFSLLNCSCTVCLICSTWRNWRICGNRIFWWISSGIILLLMHQFFHSVLGWMQFLHLSSLSLLLSFFYLFLL